ncbi:hypothetical protein GCM10016455_17230 [Aliiroseovarius zhejiangensis]|uniref:YdeI/OmpD-associated family protein n=2 Tax=Aliiroseovarius zhejiangensis TaxID=1632025 RepID=A0ABQ3IZ16_9RHOB|nr:hypothetical protein GCM10016455_17230 [Aliiroseovarius zhejiangensis]
MGKAMPVCAKPGGLDVIPVQMKRYGMALQRPIQPMPPDIDARLRAGGLRDAYEARPPYQRNDYLAWIARAKRPETREKRVAQMLEELAGGRLYMKMQWRKGQA